MPFYHKLGKVPPKRHLAFRQEDGSLYPEQLMGNKGFVGPSSLLYHLRPPTAVLETETRGSCAVETEPGISPRHRHLRTGELPVGGSPVLNRTPLMANEDVTLWMARPDSEDDFYYRNGSADELIYVSDGSGTLETQFGPLAFRGGDYLVIPRGILHRYRLDEKPARMLVVESRGYVRTPSRYRNEHGQLLEGAPYSERDFRRPEELVVHDETGRFLTVVKQGDQWLDVILDHHPLDAVGWDGYYYPWAFSIHDFEPKVARTHLPPPVHQTFEAEGFVVCSFCPRPYDFDPEAVPAPYNHSNVMSDEVIYYASDEFMSRKGIAYGSVTLHPDGLPHGPHPGTAEASIGKAGTNELAVMVDTFRPLRVARKASACEDGDYFRSWTK